MGNQKSGIAIQPRLKQFRAMLRDAKDPFAVRLIQEIVSELESRLVKRRLLNSVLEQTAEQEADRS